MPNLDPQLLLLILAGLAAFYLFALKKPKKKITPLPPGVNRERAFELAEDLQKEGFRALSDVFKALATGADPNPALAAAASTLRSEENRKAAFTEVLAVQKQKLMATQEGREIIKRWAEECGNTPL